MKTTIQLPDSLLKEARKLAKEEHTTLKSLMEEGLRRIVSERKRRGNFKLRKATFKGNGLQPHLSGSTWEELRGIRFSQTKECTWERQFIRLQKLRHVSETDYFGRQCLKI